MWGERGHCQGSEDNFWRDSLVMVALSSHHGQNYPDEEVLNQSQEFSGGNGLFWMLESCKQTYCSRTLGRGHSFLP